MRRQIWIPALFLLASAPARAELIHRYSFTGGASDSVGGAHATVVDPGGPTHAFEDGRLDLSANTGQTSNAISDDAYVDLPNGIVSAAAAQGMSGAASFELWATVATLRTWQMFGNFGVSDGGEDVSNGAFDAPYVYVTPNSNFFADGLSAGNKAPGAPDRVVGQTGPFPTGVQAHVVVVFDHGDPSAGSNGTMTLYLDGQPLGSAPIDANLDLTTFDDVNNWLGRSQWADPLFDGLYDEFRIHDDALDASAVAASFERGPDQVPELAAGLAALVATSCLGVLGSTRTGLSRAERTRRSRRNSNV